MTVFGIDPGLEGGIAWTDGDDHGAVPMPILNGSPDLHALFRLYLQHGPALVVIEQAQATRTAPKQDGTRGGFAGTGSFKTGYNFGLIVGQLTERGGRFDLVAANKWKKAIGIPAKSGKEVSVQFAQRLFPGIDFRKSERCKNYHDGMAEAALLAEYGYRLLRGEKADKRVAA